MAEENKRLRSLLRDRGVHEAEVDSYLSEAGAGERSQRSVLDTLLATRKDCGTGSRRALTTTPTPSSPPACDDGQDSPATRCCAPVSPLTPVTMTHEQEITAVEPTLPLTNYPQRRPAQAVDHLAQQANDVNIAFDPLHPPSLDQAMLMPFLTPCPVPPSPPTVYCSPDDVQSVAYSLPPGHIPSSYCPSTGSYCLSLDPDLVRAVSGYGGYATSL